ncbi:hypothetical protein AB6D20_012855 [Vibrio splendidus]|uniref:Uncharacterized protein n=1 Tax=Vibrio splendidus TaxID=29497 RepID=A0A2T5EYG0_VIBSP|nr:hypothetical protein [Vibrio splendidus]OEF72752.1 hypothetical protein A148_20230 [Vibrio splendidus 1F-157]PMI54591.1 hypothetical protein BCU42_01630 [Vibrio splendidus]PTP38185.1 hypothetical protein CWO07_06705 [Vibrio splendidus]PTP73201.1 hypothetical protein CWO23_06665 [Vibrio splendidus]
MKVSTGYKLLALASVIFIAYGSAWLRAYSLSENYFEYAEQQYKKGDLVTALKGMNKLELRIEDEYLGGYQQVIETWRSATLGPKPDAYYQSLEKPALIIEQLNEEQLMAFIEIYVQLDSRYVPSAADQLRYLAKQSGEDELYQEMTEFLAEAFPRYKMKEI